ncbi:hypothetical protein DY000_02029120 [Brassica cretica]|uniref:Uncharacterized protein n=1 Tax=Brassica cretica TaxID=69181 RepID=A0ABQ7DQY3_BRACR|nr:hypothetical protein DY000_02029120 [Brassica cretica]
MKKDTGESDDDVLVTPPKQYNKHNRVIEADDEFVEPPLTEPAKVCNSTSACDEKLSGDEKETGESDDDVLVTPPKQYNKHNRVIEADDEFVIGISGRLLKTHDYRWHNEEAIYYEGLHRATSLGVEEGIKVLEANVPKHGLSTLADLLRMPW